MIVPLIFPLGGRKEKGVSAVSCSVHTHTCTHMHAHTHACIHMYTHICTRMCVHICTHMHTYIRLYTHTHTNTHPSYRHRDNTHIHIHTYTHHTHTQICTHEYIQTWICTMYTCTYTRAHIFTPTHTHTYTPHVHTYIFIHTHTYSHRCEQTDTHGPPGNLTPLFATGNRTSENLDPGGACHVQLKESESTATEKG